METPVIRKSLWNNRKINFDKFDAIGNIVDKYLGGQAIPISVEDFATILSKPPIRKNDTSHKRPRSEDKETVASEPKKRGRPTVAVVEKEKETKKEPKKKCLEEALFGFILDNRPIKKQTIDFFQNFLNVATSILRFGYGASTIVKYLKTITWMYWENRDLNVAWACENYSIVFGEIYVTLLKSILLDNQIPEFLYGLQLVSLLLSTQKFSEFPNEKEITVKNMPANVKLKLDEMVLFQSSHKKTFIEKLKKYSEVFECCSFPHIRCEIFQLFPIQYAEDERLFDDVILRGQILCESVRNEYEAWLRALHKLLQSHMRTVKVSRDKMEKLLKNINNTQLKPTGPVTASSSVLPKVGNPSIAANSAQPKPPVTQPMSAAAIANNPPATSANPSIPNPKAATVFSTYSTVQINKALGQLNPVEHNFLRTIKSTYHATIYELIFNSFLNFKILCNIENCTLEARQQSFDQFRLLIPAPSIAWIVPLQTLYPGIKLPGRAGVGSIRAMSSTPVVQSMISSTPTTMTTSSLHHSSSVTTATIAKSYKNHPLSSNTMKASSIGAVSSTTSAFAPGTSHSTKTSSALPIAPNTTANKVVSAHNSTKNLPFTLRILPTAIISKYAHTTALPLSASSIYLFFEQLLSNQKKLLLNAGFRAELMLIKEPVVVEQKEESEMNMIPEQTKELSIMEKLQSENAPHKHTTIPINLFASDTSFSEEQRLLLESVETVIQSFDSATAVKENQKQEILYYALKAYLFRPEQSTETISSISSYYEIPFSEFSELVSRVQQQRDLPNGTLEDSHSSSNEVVGDKKDNNDIELHDAGECSMDVESSVEPPPRDATAATIHNSVFIDLSNDDEDTTIQQPQEHTSNNNTSEELFPQKNNLVSEKANESSVSQLASSSEQLNDNKESLLQSEEVAMDHSSSPPEAESHSYWTETPDQGHESSLFLSPTKSTSAVPLDDDHVILGMKSINQSTDNNNKKEPNTRYFRITKHSKVKKLMKKYCERQSVPLDSVQVSWKGMILKPTSTIESIGVVNYSELFVTMK